MSRGSGSGRAKKKSLMLTVVDALNEDAGLGIATINRAVQEDLGVRNGDIVQISFNGESAVAVVEEGSHKSPSHTSLSRNTHNQLGIVSGKQVKVSRADVADAERVVISPSVRLPEDITVDMDWNVQLKNHLSEVSLTEGTKVWIPMRGMECRFNVLNVKPKGVVRVTKDTEFALEE